MKKVICLLLSMLLVLSFAACGNNQQTQTPTEATKETTQETTQEPTVPQAQVETVSNFYMDIKSADQEVAYFLNAYVNEDGTAYLEYNTASGHKQGIMEAQVLEVLAAAFRGSGLEALNGQEIYEDGAACGSAYITIGEEIFNYSYYGPTVPQEYATAFAGVEAIFVQLMVNVEEYVAKLQINGEIDQEHLEIINQLMADSGIQALDSLGVMALDTADEFFSGNAGLSSGEGIEKCTGCTAIMMTVPYSLMLVTVTEGTDVNTVAEDFADNIDWLKWVCVQPNSATVAVKDNMVLCLIGNDEMYTGTAAAIDNAGWTVVETLKNPNV